MLKRFLSLIAVAAVFATMAPANALTLTNHRITSYNVCYTKLLRKEGAVELLTKVEEGFELPIAILRNPGDCTGTSSLVAPYLYSLSSRCVV